MSEPANLSLGLRLWNLADGYDHEALAQNFERVDLHCGCSGSPTGFRCRRCRPDTKDC